jgi:DNA-binding response OmpR family regulator
MIRATDNEVDFIFISASKEIMDFKNAIEIQALDFLMKPYSFEDFKNALTKFAKKRAMESSNIIDINDTIKYDKLKRCIVTKDGEIELTLKEQKLIRLAAQFRCKIITYDQIALALDHEEVNLTSIKNIILRLRKKLPTDIFSNMMGVGYRVVC